MSGDFTYVWDAELHVVPETLEQANEMFDHFHAVAREHRTFEQLPKMAAYTRALSDYYKQHDLDRHNRPEFEHIDRGVVIIEEGLTFGSAQHYHAVQLAVAQGLVFFEVDADMAFLPDGRVLPESKQFAWQQHGLRLAQEASKPVDQVFPGTEKESIKRLYNVMNGFIDKHGFVKTKDIFRINKETSFGEIRGGSDVSINSLGLMVGVFFATSFKVFSDFYYRDAYWTKLPYAVMVNVIDFFEIDKIKYKNIDVYPKAHRIEIQNNDIQALTYVLEFLPSKYEYYYYKLQDMVWVNQLVNHNNFHYGTVNAHPDLRLILAAVNNDPCFDQIAEEGRKDKVRFFLKHKENPCPDEAAAEQKYAEYVEYVRNMKTVPWQLEEIPPEYQVKRPEGLLLVHELDVKLKENEVYNTGFTLPVDGGQQYVLKFITSAEKEQTSFSLKQQEDEVHLTFANWSTIKDYELPEPHLIGKTDEGQDMLMSFRIKANMVFKPKHSLSGSGEGTVFNSILTLDITYDLLWQVYIKR